VAHASPLIAGVNCSPGAREIRPHITELSKIADTYTACHPNAGLPNAFGGYDQTPEETAYLLKEFADERLVNIVGGCCGTTLEHIARIAAAVRTETARTLPRSPAGPRFSGLEPFTIGPDTGFVMIGERTNVTGSTRFRRLIEADDYQAAVAVALDQVRGGANLLDSERAMTTFLNLIATEPEVTRIPVMIDSSRWSVVEAGLKCVQGKGVANSISLKEGEQPFLDHARKAKQYGAAWWSWPSTSRPRPIPGTARWRSAGAPMTCWLTRRASARRTSSSTPTCSRSPPGFPSTTATPRRSSSPSR
jgi:5-methyltetrahydrofolate--homocysteine methyltransferase